MSREDQVRWRRWVMQLLGIVDGRTIWTRLRGGQQWLSEAWVVVRGDRFSLNPLHLLWGSSSLVVLSTSFVYWLFSQSIYCILKSDYFLVFLGLQVMTSQFTASRPNKQQIHEIKDFNLTARTDGGSVKIKRTKDAMKLKVRWSKYLYTLVCFIMRRRTSWSNPFLLV